MPPFLRETYPMVLSFFSGNCAVMIMPFIGLCKSEDTVCECIYILFSIVSKYIYKYKSTI